MSESIVRKIQPFTIRTKLSAPAVTPKCSDFHDDYLPNRTFSDSCKLRHLNEQVCLYLNQHEDECCVSPNAASRSIRKITISSQIDTLTAGMEMKNINNNNNNSKTSNTQLPKIVGVSCENKPNTHFKVLLCKDGEKQCSADREKYSSSPQRLDGSSCEDKDTCLSAKVSSVQNEHSFAEQKALFNKEISQAEMWIRAKLRDLRDGNNIQKSPVTDWEEACQTLQRDLKDFENTVIQLNQMGEQLMCKLNPTSDLVKKQLAQIRDQWNALKLTAANQMKAMGGAKNLQEFNRKVERLEAWIKEKEQEQSLANILGENIDKMQITRKILDLKQDEQLYRNLHEEINQMALRLEKQGKTEGKSISAHRKHINKIWLKAQSHLKEHHENLQLALEVSSFYQQAENIICSIISMNKSPSSGVENSRDGEIRDIASQIMMLDVSVSQLSNLQPALAARVTQKQSELKDCWAAFQKTLRNEKAAQLPSLTREGSDPETPSQEPPGSVGTDPHRIMGKEVKEEQNRLKGFTVVRDVESSRKPSDSGDAAHSCVSDIPVNLQTESESSGHPPLHIQLQKFTVSADKTLSWLKESVAMATQICSLSGPNGFDAAKRRQASLQQEILSNKARIELVKKEGHSLVKAQHPGSLKIQEFLSQLEVLWDELKRRHQRNGLVLKLSEELNCRVVRMLQALGSLEAWLEAVELSIRQASLSGDPESVSVAEQESRELEQELETRRLELRDLRLEVDHLSRQKHLQTQLLPARLMEVEKKFSSVQTALTQQSSELKDTRMLTEFLEKLELEENHYSTLGKPLCSDLDSGASLLGRRHDDRLMEAIGNPVKELREAVEMLNDTARERGRTQTHDHSIQQLINTHAMVSARVEQCLRRCAELAVDVLEMESEMAVKCEPDRCGLDDLQEYQDQLEAEYGLLKQEVELMKSLWIRLSDVCPERMTSVSSEIQSSLDSWMELSKSLSENKKRLLQFTHLRHFFRRYLDMISWTEDTRSCIFSESALRQSRQNQEPLVEVLDRQIQHKFEEFDRLALAGQKLFDHQHHLSKMIRERMEELRSMLGWILVHWRAQKDQLLNRQKTEDEQRQEDAIYSEAAVCSSLTQKEILPAACRQKTEMLPVSPPADLEDALQFSNDEYEVMKSVSPVGGECRNHSERAESPYLLLKESSPSSLGGTVNLILSFSEAGDTQIQLQSSGGENDMPEPEPMHRPADSHSSACKSFWKRCQGLFGSLKRKKKIYRHSAEEVSTYLHVMENNMAVAPVYESMTVPRNKAPRPSSSSPRTSSCTSPYSSPSIEDNNDSSVHLLPKSGNISIFSSLKRKSKKAKKKKDDRRHTIQKIMGEEQSEETISPPVGEPVIYDTQTWPLKEWKRRKNARKPNSDGTQVLDYMKNPLVKDIDEECSGEVGSTVQDTLQVPTESHTKTHCRFLSLGSVLSFDLPKDMSLIPSIQDVITIGLPEQKKADSHQQDSQVDRPTSLSTFKLTRSPPMQKEEPKQTSPTEVTLKIDCKDSRKISIDTISFTKDTFPPPPSPVVEDLSVEENHQSSLTDILQKQFCGIGSVPNAISTQLNNHSVSPPEEATQEINSNTSSVLVHNPIGQVFHKLVKTSRTQQLSPNPASHVVLSFRSNGREDSVDSGHSSSGSFKLGTEGLNLDSTECPISKRTIAKVSSMDAGVSNRNLEFSKEKSLNLSLNAEDTVHPDHQQFEQEEEELEDIWNQTNSCRESLNSDIMYNGYQGLPATYSPGKPRESSPKEQAVLHRKLVTASAPNLLVAEFKLPSSIQTLVACGKLQNSKEERQIWDKENRRSWAAFSVQEQVYKEVTVNETASDPVKLPEIEDQQKYIYHYREEEEDEEEKETGFLKDQSMSLLSLHMGLDDSDMQSGRQELELPSMEGTLERKHKLQLGGKKAPCRAWSSYHAVLYKHTICFYQDRKDTLKSCVTSLPLNLIGAVCEPSPEYTKKPNCFYLRLRDGSEYLLSASSRFMMKKWILRIQAHTASGGCVSARHGSSATLSRYSPAISCCQCADKCLCSMRNYVSTTVLAQSQQNSGRTKEIIVHTTDRHQDLSFNSCSNAGHCDDDFESVRQNMSSVSTTQDWTSEKRRSHSFTSATYQRIKPVAPPPGRVENSSSSYSVTLFIGERETSPVICKNRKESCSDLPITSYSSLPRHRNKSVFRKFFGMKE
ncbi:uncharacterized protein LOC130239459 isoform X2 [Danio aesculapii]|uniref:uncharacterized protein LOC130239459 isoform X2 n=1 Tax=Danio aesculapii TaxID=1142201 RepID=UPI0024C09274|nr:uncharacterized protein LOC130239459 isoform X2 [Danio aesculapii]